MEELEMDRNGIVFSVPADMVRVRLWPVTASDNFGNPLSVSPNEAESPVGDRETLNLHSED